MLSTQTQKASLLRQVTQGNYQFKSVFMDGINLYMFTIWAFEILLVVECAQTLICPEK